MRFLIAFLLLIPSAYADDFPETKGLFDAYQLGLIIPDPVFTGLSQIDQCSKALKNLEHFPPNAFLHARLTMTCRPGGWDGNWAGADFLIELARQEKCFALHEKPCA